MVNGIGLNSYGLSALLTQTTGADVDAKAKAAAGAYRQATPSPSAQNAAVTVTLSEQAKAAVGPVDTAPQAAVVAAARTDLDALLKNAKAASALKDGRPTIDLAGQSRRSLWAVATNAESKFTLEERVVATLEMNKRRDATLATPAAAVRVTGDYANLYRSYLSSLDAAGPEEKATSQWSKDRAAVLKGLDASITRPGVMPVIDGDPVATYLKDSGSVVASPRTRDINNVASDVRAVLDSQYAAAGRDEPGNDGIDFSRFDDRSLAAVALNKGGLFSERETALAAVEVKDRSWGSVSGYYADAKASSDPSALGQSLISHYSAMSEEERQAAGWTPEFYDRLTQIQNMRDKIAAMFDGGGGPGTSLLDYL